MRQTTGRAAIAERVRRTIAGWDGFCAVEEATFGTADPDAIAAAVERFCRAELGAPVAGCTFYLVSVGGVFGLTLADGRRVVLKAHQPREARERLAAAHRVQAALWDGGFPCPRPIVAPTPLGRGHGTVSEHRDGGGHRDAHDPAVRRVMAELLARLVRDATAAATPADVAALGRPLLLPDELWPVPHSALFDFAATAAGAEWIDAHAALALDVLRAGAGRIVVGHFDWSVKHLRFDPAGRVTAVYDWDSLGAAPEPVVVGSAARGFTMTWELPEPVALAPTPAEAAAFVAEYEAARGAPFTAAERAAVRAAAVYFTAYTARCQHARLVAGEAPEPGSHLPALRALGEGVLPP
jgi:hypothetical protein